MRTFPFLNVARLDQLSGKPGPGCIAAGAGLSWIAGGKDPLEYVCTYHPGMKAAVVAQ